MSLPDAYWAAAADVALGALEEADHVLVPAEFLDLDPRFAPLEFSWGLQGAKRLAWCCSKDDVDRLAPWLRERYTDRIFYAWANEVFVLGATFPWRGHADSESRKHLVAWFERVQRYGQGEAIRPSKERAASATGAGRQVLVVGASAMGNVGDDLLAQVLTEMLAGAGADVYLSGPDIDPLRVATYDAVIVGGGGLVYASRYGANEAQNLANYLKFGPIGRHFGVPTALIGVGDQDHASGIGRDPLAGRFVRDALPAFAAVTTRDRDSSELLSRYGAQRTKTGADLLFHWAARARAAVKPTAAQPGRLAWAGELFRYRAVAEALSADGALAAAVREGDFDVLIMSNDDVAHADHMQQALTKAGASAAIVDLRHRDFETLVFLFASYSGIVTTRFHGVVIAALAGTPLLALDVAGGKSARLLRDADATRSLLIDGDEDGERRLVAAVEGELERISEENVAKLARQSNVHRSTLHALLGCEKAAPSAVKSDSSPRQARNAHTAPWPEHDDIPLCWAASSRGTKGFANLGDSLSAVMVAALSGRRVRHTSFDAVRSKLVAVGSIGHAIKHGAAVVWGAGVSIRGGTLAQNVPLTRYDVRAVRGRISAQHYRDFGIAVPEIYGDPVWLLPSIVDEPVEKKYELGVIPHIRDVADHHPEAPPLPDSLRYIVDGADAGSVAVINTWHDSTWEGLLAKLNLIRSCKRIASQSFHGLVIAEAYGIPALNFRYLLGAKNGPLQLSLDEPCRTDPRVWEFYAGGTRPHFHMYSQHRDVRTDWESVVRAIDELWEPFEYDPAPLVDAFPLPLAYDPVHGRVAGRANLEELSF